MLLLLSLGMLLAGLFLGIGARKPLFGICDHEMIKPVCSAKETSSKIEILHEASLAMILSRQRMTQTLIRLRGCCSRAIKSGWLFNSQKFLMSDVPSEIFFAPSR